MTLTTEQLAELLAGIARAQQAIIDGIESDNAGWRNAHLTPKITSAANMRLATPRLVDVPSRILLRSQTRVPMDVPTIVRMLNESMAAGAGVNPPPGVAPPTAQKAPPPGGPAAAPVAAAAAAAPGVAAAAGESVPAAGGDDLSNFFDT